MNLLRSFIPPIALVAAKKIRQLSGIHRRGNFEGPYRNWDAAVSNSKGWDDAAATEKTFQTAIKVRDGEIAFEVDTVEKAAIVYSAPILAFLLLAHRNGALNIIDFGGGLGINYFQNRKLMQRLPNTKVRWNVVERPALATMGAEYFQTNELRFYPTLQEAMSVGEPSTAIIFSGSLQYISDPLSLLNQVISSGTKIVAFDRLAVYPGRTHIIQVQHVPENVYAGATFPCWRFSRDEFIAWFSAKGFALVEIFDPEYPEDEFYHCGMIFMSNN